MTVVRTKENIFEGENTGAARYPLCRLQCASSKPFTVSRGVPQRNRISHRIEADLVCPGVLPRTAGTHIDRPGKPALFHGTHQREKRTRRGILLSIVVNFP